MKKAIAVFAVLALLSSMCACEDKPAESESIGEIKTSSDTEVPTGSVSVEVETSAEQEYLELTEDDFTLVELNHDVTESSPPIDIHSVDLSDLDFGKRISPCKLTEYYDDYAITKHDYTDTDSKDKYDSYLKKLIDTPCGGMVEKAVYSDGKYFFLVNYDDLCGCHDWSIYSYDIEKGDLKELVSYTGTEYGSSSFSLMATHGKLFYPVTYYTGDKKSETYITGLVNVGESKTFIVSGNDSYKKSVVLSFDLATGEEEEVGTFDGTVLMMEETEKSLNISYHSGTNKYVMWKEYDFVTKELSDCHTIAGSGVKVLCDRISAEITGGNENGKYTPITVKTPNYTISTDLIDCKEVCVWKDKVSIITEGALGMSWMYTYDIKSREKLKLQFGGFGGDNTVQTSDGLIGGGVSLVGMDGLPLINGNSISYVNPVLGIEYNLETCDDCLVNKIGDAVYYLTISGGRTTYDEESGINVGYSTRQGLPDKLCWFELK